MGKERETERERGRQGGREGGRELERQERGRGGEGERDYITFYSQSRT